jgi:hypothetical protein
VVAGSRHELVPAQPREVDNYPRCLLGVGSDAYTLDAIDSDRDGVETGREHRVGEVDDDTGRMIKRLNPGCSFVFGRDLDVDAASASPRHAYGFERGPSRGHSRSLRSCERYDRHER